MYKHCSAKCSLHGLAETQEMLEHLVKVKAAECTALEQEYVALAHNI